MLKIQGQVMSVKNRRNGGNSAFVLVRGLQREGQLMLGVDHTPKENDHMDQQQGIDLINPTLAIRAGVKRSQIVTLEFDPRHLRRGERVHHTLRNKKSMMIRCPRFNLERVEVEVIGKLAETHHSIHADDLVTEFLAYIDLPQVSEVKALAEHFQPA